jgi:hypothetical protein
MAVVPTLLPDGCGRRRRQRRPARAAAAASSVLVALFAAAALLPQQAAAAPSYDLVSCVDGTRRVGARSQLPSRRRVARLIFSHAAFRPLAQTDPLDTNTWPATAGVTAWSNWLDTGASGGDFSGWTLSAGSNCTAGQGAFQAGSALPGTDQWNVAPYT